MIGGRGRRWTSVLAFGFALVAIGAALASAATVPAPPRRGEIGPKYRITANGRILRPQGRMTRVGDFPTGGALTPDGRFYWTVSAGFGRDDVRIVRVATGRVIQVLPIPGGYVGIAIAPDGRHAYVSGEPSGVMPAAGRTKGDAGDVVHVFAIRRRSGRAVEQAPIQIPPTTGGTAQSHAGAVVSGLPSAPGPTAGSALDWPEGLAVAPTGSKLVVALNQADKVAIVDLRTRAVRLVKSGAYPYGAAIARDGRDAYVTNEYDGTVSMIDLSSGSVVRTIALQSPGGDRNSHPEGIAADPHRDRVYVAVTNRDLVATVDTRSGAVLSRLSVADRPGVGAAPVAVALAPDGRTLYSADAGEDAVAAISVTRRLSARQARRLEHRVWAPRSAASISEYAKRLETARGRLHGQALARAQQSLQQRLLFGSPQRACFGPTRRQDHVYAQRVLAAIHTRERSLASHQNRKLINRRFLANLARAQRANPPVARCGPAAGDIAGLPANRLIGKIPTAAYPTAVAVTPNGRRLVWLAGKGLGAGPNPGYGQHFAASQDAPYGTYDIEMLLGRVGVLKTPTDRRSRALAATVARVLRPADLSGAPANTPVVGPRGGPSTKIKYVFYVVKENRTYDQLFGSDRRGDGDPQLEVFDDNGTHTAAGGVTPNAHALTRTFPLLDHFYANSEVSVDGHLITSGAYATDYVQKALQPNYANRGRVDEFGSYPVSLPPNDFIFDQAVKQGISFRNYGETSAGVLPEANDGRPSYVSVEANTMWTYPLFFACDGVGIQPNGTNNRVVCDTDSGTLGPAGNADVSNSRFDYLQAQFESELASGSVPSFNYITLPNDHTNGVRKNYPTPRATVADNDLGLGQLVDLISHSKIWGQSAIFVMEDDSQDGADHVDAHRMPGYVISPWARHGAVIHSRYDQESMLRTVELILGLRPLSLFDATAAPMWNVFSDHADLSTYSAIQPQQSLTQVTTAAQARAAGPLAAALPWNQVDEVPQALFDQVLWKSVYGPRSKPPPPGPNASPDEVARAAGALAAFRHGQNVAAYLRRSTPVGDQGIDGG